MRTVKNMTYNNLMYVINRIQKEKGYDFKTSEFLARNIFKEFASCPLGMSINERINRILTKEEFEKENYCNG